METYYELTPEELKQWCEQHEAIVQRRIEEIKAKLLKPTKPFLTLVKG